MEKVVQKGLVLESEVEKKNRKVRMKEDETRTDIHLTASEFT